MYNAHIEGESEDIEMFVQPVSLKNNNNVNFGIKYPKEFPFNKGVLDTFRNSTLAKSIDKKYPNASVDYSVSNLTDADLSNKEPDFLASLVIKLTDSKTANIRFNSHSQEGAENDVKSYINTATLDAVELSVKDSKEILEPEKPNRILNFFKRIIS